MNWAQVASVLLTLTGGLLGVSYADQLFKSGKHRKAWFWLVSTVLLIGGATVFLR